MAERTGEAVYRIRYESTGADEESSRLRNWTQAKTAADRAAASEIKASVGYGAGRVPVSPSGIVDPHGQALASAGRVQQAAAAQQEAAERRRQQQEERGYQQAERAARQQDRQAERESAAGDRMDRRRERQRQQAAAQHDRTTPRVFGAFADTGDLKSDADWTHYHQALSERYETALKDGEQLSLADRTILRNSQQIAGLSAQRLAAEKKGIAARVASAIGWAPGVPQSAYLAQMGLESLGLAGGLVLGGTLAAVGLGLGTAGYLGISGTVADQTRMAQQLAAMSGGSGAAPRPMDQLMAERLTTIGESFNLTRDPTMQAVSRGLGGLNLSDQSHILAATQLGLAEAQHSGMAPDQGIALAGGIMARLGLTAQQTATALERINQSAQLAGANLTQFGADLVSLGPYVQRDTNTGQLGFLEQLAGQHGLSLPDLMGGALTSSGDALIGQSALLGLSPDQMAAMQQQDPIALFRREQQVFQQFESRAPAGMQRAVAQGVFQQQGLMPTGAAGNLLAQALEQNLSDAQVQAFLAQQAGAGPLPSAAQFIQSGQQGNVSAAGPGVRGATLRQQVGRAAVTDWAGLLGTIGAGAAVGAVAGAPVFGIGAVPGAALGGLAGLGLDLAQLASQVHQQQVAASAQGQAGQPVQAGSTRLTIDLSPDAQRLLRVLDTSPQGQSTSPSRLVPGPGLDRTVTPVPRGTPTPGSLTGR